MEVGVRVLAKQWMLPARRAAAILAVVLFAGWLVPLTGAAAAPVCEIATAATVAAGSSGNAASVADAGAGASYAWSVTGGSITSGAGTAEITWSAGGQGTATLSVTVSDAGSAQCSDSATVSVDESVFAITVEPATPTVAAGEMIVFTIFYQCSSQGQDCEDVLIDWGQGSPEPGVGPASSRYPYWELYPPWGTCDNGMETGSWSGGAKIALGTVAAGTSGSCTVRLRVRKYYTPDGTELQLAPVITSSNASTRSDNASVTVTAAGTLVVGQRLSTSPLQPVLGYPFRYDIGIGVDGNWGFDSYTLTDTLPVGAELVQVDVPAETGFPTCTAATSPCTNGHVTVTITAATASTGAVVRIDYDYSDRDSTLEAYQSTPVLRSYNAAQITVSYPESFSTASVTNNATVTGYLMGDEHLGANLKQDDEALTHGFAQPTLNTNARKLATGSGQAGGTLTWSVTDVGISAPSQYFSNVPTDVVITDSPIAAGPYQDYFRTRLIRLRQYGEPVPAELTITTASTGTRVITVPATSFAEQGSSSVAELVIPELGGDTGADYLTGISAKFAGLPALSNAGIEIQGYFDASIESVITGAVNVTNCAQLTTALVDQAPAAPRQACATKTISPRTPQMGLFKDIAQVSAMPGDAVDVQLHLTTGALASIGRPINPAVIDVLPASMTLVPGSVSYAGNFYSTTGLPEPQMDVIENYQGSGRQALRWAWPGGETMAPGIWGTTTFVTYKVRLSTALVAGDVLNEAYGLDTRGTLAAPPNSSCGPLSTDVWDADGDGVTSEPACYDTDFVRIPAAAGAKVQLSVQGSQDSTTVTSPATGKTAAGEGFGYQVSFTNTGTLALQDAVIYDVLPFVGDTYSSQALAGRPRNSQWQVDLAGLPTSDFSGTTIVEYSASTNPCREEVYPAAPGCVDDWTALAPTDLSTVRALRVRLTGRLLLPGEVVQLRVPVQPNAPHLTTGEVAWNSVAQSATIAGCTVDCQLLAAEPAKVGVAAVNASVAGAVLLDADRDGTAQPSEGLAEIPVLLECTTTEGDLTYGPVSTSDGTTDVNGDGNPDPIGSYYFADVAAGSCRVQVLVDGLPAIGLRAILDPDQLRDSQTDFSLAAGQQLTGLDFAYAEVKAEVKLEKSTNGVDADTESAAPEILLGEQVEWIYLVTNTGEVPLTGVSVSDDDASLLIDCGDGTAVVANLPAGQSVRCRAIGVAELVNYTNLGTVLASPECPDCIRPLAAVSAADRSHYRGVAAPVDETDDAGLAFTGWSGIGLLWLAAVMLMAGGLLLWRRHRQN